MVGAIEGVGDAKCAREGGEFLGLRGEDVRGVIGCALVAGADGRQADVSLKTALASVRGNGGVLVERDIPLSHVAGGGAGDVEGDAVIEHTGTDTGAEGDAQDSARERFERGDVVCGGVGVGRDEGSSRGGEACAGEEVLGAQADEGGDVGAGGDGARDGVEDAGEAEADGIRRGSENCGDVGDGVDEVIKGWIGVGRTLGDADDCGVVSEGGLDAAAADVEAEGCVWLGGLGGVGGVRVTERLRRFRGGVRLVHGVRAST